LKKTVFKKYVALIILIVTIMSLILLETKIYAIDANTTINIKFTDFYMYNKICEKIQDKITTKNDIEKSISISLTNLETVTKLELNNSNISNIEGIEKFTALTELNISNNRITDISVLSSLTSLKKLSAYGNTISNISPVSNLNNLEYLNIAKNRLIDSAENSQNAITKSISTLTNITQLDMSHNYLRYTNGIEKLKKLENLNLYDNAICDLTGLNTLTNLTSLNLGENNENGTDNGIIGLESLKNLTKLEEFDFSENKTPNIMNNISELINLKKLSLQRNKIKSIEGLGNLTNLEILNLYYNEIETIPQELSNLVNLKELILGNNWLYDITGLYKNDTINFKQLKKIDLSKNESIETISQNEKEQGWTKRVENNLKIMKLLTSSVSEVNDENITDTSNLPHYDKNGVAYVTYDDFGARCDGVYDDFIAIRNAHIFANKNGCEVRATQGRTYHIFKYYEDAVTVTTNVDWQNANFIIHDEEIEKVSGRYIGIFKFTNITDIITINNPTWTIGKNTKTIPEIVDTLKQLDEKGYQSYLCGVVNSDKKQYIRYGSNGNSGDNQQDYFIVDNKANILNDIQWDFEKITEFTIYPISNSSLNIKNGNFISNAINSQSETPYTRYGSGKGIYFARNIYINKASNVNISGISHKLSYELNEDEMSGSYMGFIYTNIIANLDISDCTLFNRKYSVDGRSTYDLNLCANVNVKCKNINSNNITDLDRWGVMDTLFSKDVLFENCKLNRIDAHQGIYNLTVKNCNIGSKGLTMTGQGTLDVIGTTIESDTFITLRGDYGSTWNGDVNIIDCTYKYNGIWAPKLFNTALSYDNNQLHNFGYECKMPNINVHNFTIDMQQNKKDCFYIMSINGIKLEEPYLENTKDYLKKYLPVNVNLNQYKFVNTANDIKLEVVNTNGNGNIETYLNEYNYVISNALLTEKDSNENLLKKIEFKENLVFDKSLDFEISKNTLTQNNLSIYKDGQAIIENKKIDDKYTYNFTEDGKYKIEIASLEEKNQYKGNKSYTFTIDMQEESIDDIEEEQNKQIEYTETLENFENPERGFYRPVYIRYKEDNNKPINITHNLVHLRLDIGAFSKVVNGKQDIPLTQDMLEAFNQTLKSIKANGGTAIVRFAYTYEGKKNMEPSIDMILTHIKQVCPILTQNQEVVAYIELGFFGPWGEMHSSDVCTEENVNQAINVMLENTPKKMKIGVRQPKYYTNWAGIDRAKLNENVTIEGTDEYRIGLFNDGYLGSESDLGTFANREIEIQWLEKQALHTLYGGEVVASATQGQPLNTAEYMSKEAFRTHTSYLNIEYNNKVIDSWKQEIYNGEDSLYKGQTGYTYIANHLGYRFVLRKSEIQESVKSNEKLNIDLDIENVGFANLVNKKVVSLVFVKNDEVYEVKTNIDATKWNSKEITHINIEKELPRNMSYGEWEVYLRISEYGNMNIDNNYKTIRLANNGEMWNEVIGANYIGKFTIQEPQLKATKLGIGGGGALFEPAISPFNSNEMLVVPDMGGIYISHNKGENWDRVNLYGTVISATYDPNLEGVIYAGGSGLYRSTDNGNNFELIFPKEDDIIARYTHNENGLQYYFTHSGIYDRNKYVKNILIDPDDSNHIFILCYSYKNGIVFESTDNGENFNKLFTYTKSTSPSIQFDFNELIYRKETKDLFVINDEQIIRYNLDAKTQTTEYESDLGLVDVTTVYEDNKTYFIIIEKTDELENSDTKVYYTNDFKNKIDITDTLTSVQPNSFHNNTYGDITYKYDFHYISATSLNNIYITNWSYQNTSSIKPYPYTIDGIIRYHNGEAKYLYGNPFKDHNTLASRGWCDGNTYSLGIATSKQNEDEFIFTTLCGVCYSPDNTHIYPRYSTVTEGVYPNAKYVTSGIDEQATYGVYEDPFHEGVLLLLNTDLGLIRSEDNGKSWTRAINGIPNKWNNTIYDAAFDQRKENYVYSLWSGRHNAPYDAKNETDGRYGGFAISTDGGKTWDATYSSGLPENAIPVKMSVVYPENSDEVTIYVATFNEGFFVSYDSGKTFTEMNNGIEKVSYKEEEKYQYILASDIEVKEGHIFGITAKNYYNNEDTQSGQLYEYIDGIWQKIELPKNVKTPRDIYYHDGILYISGVATPVWDYKNGTDFNNFGGGVYTYKDGIFTQIFDESISTTSVQIDSRGTIYISDINGNIYRKETDKDYEKIYDSYFYISKGLQISSDDDYLYLASFGGGLLKLENLNSLYSHKCIGGIATCTKKAICDVCGKEYGDLDKNNHSSNTTHKVNEKQATCSEEGYTGDIVYDCCNEIKEKGTIVEKIEHKYDNGKITKEATYEAEGEKTYTCKICNETKTEIIPKLKNQNISDNSNNNNEDVSNKNDEDIPNDNHIDNNNTEKQEQYPSNFDNTIAQGKLPQTGKTSTIGFLIVILALITLAVYSKIKLNKID